MLTFSYLSFLTFACDFLGLSCNFGQHEKPLHAAVDVFDLIAVCAKFKTDETVGKGNESKVKVTDSDLIPDMESLELMQANDIHIRREA